MWILLWNVYLFIDWEYCGVHIEKKPLTIQLEEMDDWTLEKCRKVQDIPKTAEGPVFEHMGLPSSADTYEKQNDRKYDMLRQ